MEAERDERAGNLASQLRGAARVGCVGSRDLPPDAAAACRQIAADLVRGGYAVVTGATPGEPGRDLWADWAEGAFAYGAARVDPQRLTVCLPWRHFPRGARAPEAGVTAEYASDHPDWSAHAARFWAQTHDATEADWARAVPRATRLRRERGVGVVLGARMLLAWPHGPAEGTRFALACAAWMGVHTLDLTQTAWWTVAPGLVERLRALERLGESSAGSG